MKLRQKIALELARKIRNNDKQLHVLRQLFLESTLRCNVHCRHCGSDCKAAEQTPDMPFADFLRAIDSITPHVDPHKVMIIISGGEPLVRDDLELCGAELYRRGFPWGMVTNGLYLTPQRYQQLLDAGLHALTISLDGFETDHNWLRGHKQSFQKAADAVRMVADTPSQVVWDVVTCVNRRNIKTLPEFAEFLYRIGVRRWRLFTIDPMGRAKNMPELHIDDADFVWLLDFIAALRKEGKMHVSYSCEGFLGDYEGFVRDHFYQCAAGISIASVLIDGSISACTSIRGKYYQGNIYTDDFWDVWQNRFQNYRNREWMRKDACADCKMFRYCEGNGMHLRDVDGNLMVCHYQKIQNAKQLCK